MDEEGRERYDIGEIVGFARHRKNDAEGPEAFFICCGDEFPSVPLNPSGEDPELDVKERGRLKFSADSLDFFTEEGNAGISASNRIMGVVLHDVLAHVRTPDDLTAAVSDAVLSGDLTCSEAENVKGLLETRINQVRSRGWFPACADNILNETSLIDTDGRIYRPDRVVLDEGRVIIVDYKFGEHDRRYERQLKRYSDIWRRMGYEDVSAFLWYIHTGNIIPVN